MTTPTPTNINSKPPTHLNPPPLIIHPTAAHQHKTTLILLHGTSTSGPIFAEEILNHPIPIPTPPSNSSTSTPPPPITSTSTATTTKLPHHLPSTRLIFPSGSPKPLTVLNLPTSNSWFDIHSFTDRTLNAHLAISDIAQSVTYLRELIYSEIKLLDGNASRLVLVGFSSGCAIGALVVLSLLDRDGVETGLGGFIGMSGYLPFRTELESTILATSPNLLSPADRRAKARAYVAELLSLPASALKDKGAFTSTSMSTSMATPLFFTHGKADTKVRPEWGRQMSGLLGEGGLGLDVKVKEYEGLGHELGGEEMVDLVGFLKEVWGEEVLS